MDRSIDRALKEKAELEARLAKLNNYIEMHHELFGGGEHFFAMEKSVNIKRKRKVSGTVERLKQLAAEAIRLEGRPLTRGEVTERVMATGIAINSKDPANYIGTVMWRNPEIFLKIDGLGYWLAGVPLPDDQKLNSPSVD
jgi:hypothetical protein